MVSVSLNTADSVIHTTAARIAINVSRQTAAVRPGRPTTRRRRRSSGRNALANKRARNIGRRMTSRVTNPEMITMVAPATTKKRQDTPASRSSQAGTAGSFKGTRSSLGGEPEDEPTHEHGMVEPRQRLGQSVVVGFVLILVGSGQIG